MTSLSGNSVNRMKIILESKGFARQAATSQPYHSCSSSTATTASLLARFFTGKSMQSAKFSTSLLQQKVHQMNEVNQVKKVCKVAFLCGVGVSSCWMSRASWVATLKAPCSFKNDRRNSGSMLRQKETENAHKTKNIIERRRPLQNITEQHRISQNIIEHHRTSENIILIAGLCFPDK